MDKNSMVFWYPQIEAAGIPTPRTYLTYVEGDVDSVLDGDESEAFLEVVRRLGDAGDGIGWPCFLRTGHGSGKHQWNDTCYVPARSELAQHVFNLIEWSHVVDLMGLPTNAWAIRELLQTEPLFHCQAYGNFPVTREFRYFVNEDGLIVHHQPYWPDMAVEQGRPDDPAWKLKLHNANQRTSAERAQLRDLAHMSWQAVGGGYWSIDILQDANDQWYVTDMAEALRSFMYDPETQADMNP
jgi:hypothetical protein